MGPCFDGGGCSELDVLYEPFNDVNSCSSFTNEPGYDIPVDGAGLNMLTNKKNLNFTITELEVWEVKGYVHEDKLVFYDAFELKKERIRKLEELGVLKSSDETDDDDEEEEEYDDEEEEEDETKNEK